MKRSTICKLIGHRRYPLDCANEHANIVNVDGCRRCGQVFVANKPRRVGVGAVYEHKTPRT